LRLQYLPGYSAHHPLLRRVDHSITMYPRSWIGIRPISSPIYRSTPLGLYITSDHCAHFYSRQTAIFPPKKRAPGVVLWDFRKYDKTILWRMLVAQSETQVQGLQVVLTPLRLGRPKRFEVRERDPQELYNLNIGSFKVWDSRRT
jgi:hypothetical protein